jgi:2-isopropylmalate synthase
MTQVRLYDTTLRDGMQGQGMTLSAAEQVRVVKALDGLGVHFVEAGFPSSNPKEEELFRLLTDVELEQATICAFGMTRRRGVAADEDPALRQLVDSEAPVCTLVGKTWALHLEVVTKVSPEENLAMIVDSINLCRAERKRVIYDAEHFFDAWRDDHGYALECLRAAAAAGAENLTLCDTNGSSLPSQVAEATAAVVGELRGRVEIGIHAHNDAECGVANSLAAVEAGARLVQGTINGYGERCGNANLVSVLPALQLKLGHDCVPADRLRLLTETAHFVDELTNLNPDPDQPYVGRNAFAHKGGMHVAGVQADARTFEHLDPKLVGNSRDVLISELSGKGSVLSRAEGAGIDLDADAAKRAVERIKEREHRGYHYEAADASFELLLRREAGEYQSLFRLESFRVITEKRADGRVDTEATIKIWVDGRRYVRTAEGNGPVNALDRALRDAIGELHPHLADIELVDYKVRILDSHHGTGAVTRVLLDSSDSHESWGSIGVSENIIEASWEALVDSLEYAFQPRTSDPAASSSARPGAAGSGEGSTPRPGATGSLAGHG